MSDTDFLSVEDLAHFNRVRDTMDLVSDRVEVLRLLGFEARWEWRTVDEFPLIRIGRRTW